MVASVPFESESCESVDMEARLMILPMTMYASVILQQVKQSVCVMRWGGAAVCDLKIIVYD